MSGLKDQVLMAYVDGELDEGQRQALEASIAGDPELAREVERQRALRAGVQGAFAAVVDEPVPDRLTALITGEERLVLRPQFARATRKAQGFRPAHWAAMAASLAVGAGLGLAVRYGPGLLDPEPIATEDGRMVARGALAEALDSQLAADQGGPVQIGLSFRGQGRAYCRTFALADAGLAGLACRDGGGWSVRATADAVASQGEYRAAASATPAPILAAAEELIDGEPLDQAQEAAARARDWRD